MRIGELLVAAQMVSEADVARAIERQREDGGRLGANLVATGAITQEALDRFWDAIPMEPSRLAATGIDEKFLLELMVKLLFSGPAETVAELASAMRLTPKLVADLIEAATRGQMVTALGGAGLGMRYELTETGKTRAREAMARSSYMGPAPVSLDSYVHWIERQKVTNEVIDVPRMRRAFEGLEVADALTDQLGPAITSGRAILMYGPPATAKPPSPSASTKSSATSSTSPTPSSSKAR